MAESESSETPTGTSLSPEDWTRIKEVEKMSSDEIKENLKKYDLCDKGIEIILKKRLKEHIRRTITCQSVHQLYDFLLIIDFEATCEKSDNPNYKHEIIEFPIVLFNMKTLKITDTFHSYCRPKLNSRLSDFCIELTLITQQMVDNAPPFIDVLANAETWLQKHKLFDKKFAVVCDCNADMATFMRIQCRISDIKIPDWCRYWINVKNLFRKFYSIPREQRVPLRNMLAFLYLEFKGQQHSGMSDARNITRVVKRLVKDGCILYINEKLLTTARPPNFSVQVSWENSQRNLRRFFQTSRKDKDVVPPEIKSKTEIREGQCSELLSDETDSSLSDLMYMIKLRK